MTVEAEVRGDRPQRRIGPAARGKGQRESLCIASALALMAAGAPAGEAIRVETPAPVVDVAAGHGVVVASMALEGVAWLPVAAPENLRARADWPTLSALAMPGGKFLLCGRDSLARVVRYEAASGDMVLEMSWPVESVPNEAVFVEDGGRHVAMACGGGGVLLWDWADRLSPPRLVGRYPFAGFARTVARAGDGVLLVADSHEYGMMTLDVRDPLRPHKLGNFVLRGYCDDVAFDGSSLWSVNRVFGTDQLAPNGTFTEFERVAHYDPLVPANPDYRAASVFADGEVLLVSELRSGVRVFRRCADGWTRAGTSRAALLAIEAIPLPDGRIAVADFAGAVVLAPVDSKN